MANTRTATQEYLIARYGPDGWYDVSTSRSRGGANAIRQCCPPTMMNLQQTALLWLHAYDKLSRLVADATKDRRSVEMLMEGLGLTCPGALLMRARRDQRHTASNEAIRSVALSFLMVHATLSAPDDRVAPEFRKYTGPWWVAAVSGAMGHHRYVSDFEFDPSWRTEAVAGLGRTIVEDRRLEVFPVLADALEDAGCGHPDLGYLRSGDEAMTAADWWAHRAAYG